MLVRLFWMMLGPCVLFFLAFFIARRPTLPALDIAFWAIVVALIVVRHIDITRLNGLTAEGEPATLHHWRRFVFVLILVSGTLWLLAHTLFVRFMGP